MAEGKAGEHRDDGDDAGGRDAPGNEAEARRRRLEALHALASGAPAATPAATNTPRVGASARPHAPGGPRTRRWRPRRMWWVALGAVVCLVVLGAMIVPRILQRAPVVAHTMRPAGPLTIALGQDGLGCPYVAAWSPDATKIALLAHDRGCSGAVRAAVYDAATGKLLAQLKPADQMNYAVTTVRPGASSAPGALYVDDILWSPDGHRLALPFISYASLSAGGNPALVNGLYVSDRDGSHAQAYASLATSPPYMSVWTLGSQLQPVAQFAPPSALGYYWGQEQPGTLIPDTPLGATAPPAPPLRPVGVPDGASPFTIWQPGTLTWYLTNPNTRQAEPPGAFTYTSYFAAWSPDGQYLADGLGVMGRLQPATLGAPSQQSLSDFGVANDPVLPVRDAALESVMEANVTPTTAALSLAWRPDGLWLAAQAIGGGRVSLYDCASGKLVGTLAPATSTLATPVTPSAQRITDATSNALRWSPDGTRLVALDGVTNSVTIWGPGALPK